MEEREVLLRKLKPRQIKPTPVKCTCNSLCWCNELSFRFPMNQPWEECRSPAEMLEEYGAEMDEADRRFLKSLLGRPFESNC